MLFTKQRHSQIMAAVSAVSMPNMNRAGNLAKVWGLAMPPAMVLVTWPPKVMAPCRGCGARQAANRGDSRRPQRQQVPRTKRVVSCNQAFSMLHTTSCCWLADRAAVSSLPLLV
jgi:hypothetical protein